MPSTYCVCNWHIISLQWLSYLFIKKMHKNWHSFKPHKTNLYLWRNLNLVDQRNDFTIKRFHCYDCCLSRVELDAVNSGKQLLEVRLNHSGVCWLTKNLQQIIVSNEIKSRKRRALLLHIYKYKLYRQSVSFLSIGWENLNSLWVISVIGQQKNVPTKI